MKKVITLFAAATIAVNVFGGLFDNVTKSVIGTLSPEERERQRKAEAEERAKSKRAEQGNRSNIIDAKITTMPKTSGILGWKFGEIQKGINSSGKFPTKWCDGNYGELGSAFREWFADVQLELAQDGALCGIEMSGEVKKLNDDSRLSLYFVLRWMGHNFDVLEEQRAKAFLLSGDSYPHNAYFRKTSSDGRYKVSLDSNYGRMILRVEDLSVREKARAKIEAKRAEQEKESGRRRAAIIAEQEERARQEELRKAEEHKAYMARLEKEEQERRKREQKAAQAERERQKAEMAERQRKHEEERQREENEKNHEIIVNYLSALRKDADRMNKSVYLTKQTLANIPQFPSHPLMSGHVQLYKNVCSGSSLLWSIGQLANFGQYGSHFNVERPYSVPNASLQDYDGIAIPVNEVLLYCTVEGVDEVNVEEIGKGDFFDVEVFGFRKKFPREVTADDILSHTVAKYNDPKVTRNTTVTSTALLGHPGIVRTTTQTICEFINDAVIGHIGQESYEYSACSSDIARWYAYVEIASNLPPNHPLKVACRTQESILEADIAKGMYKKEIDAFNTNCIGWNDKTTTKEAFWAEIKSVEYAMSQYSHYNDRIKARANQMVVDAAKSEEIKNMPKRGEAILHMFDKKAIDLLPLLKQKRCEAVRARETAQKAEKERSIKNEALNF